MYNLWEPNQPRWCAIPLVTCSRIVNHDQVIPDGLVRTEESLRSLYVPPGIVKLMPINEVAEILLHADCGVYSASSLTTGGSRCLRTCPDMTGSS